jgi:hypothetical protein
MVKVIRCTNQAHAHQPRPAAPLTTGEGVSDYLINRFDTEGASDVITGKRKKRGG